jgi:hypothetical protein
MGRKSATGPPAALQVQYFGHNAVTIKFVTPNPACKPGQSPRQAPPSNLLP